MEDKELSQWFDINVQKPWEPGVYVVDEDAFATWFSYWDGNKFGYLVMDANEAIEEFSLHTDFIVEKWRGLASNPNAKPKPRGNRKVTRYVVTSDGDAVAAFASKALAEAYAKSIEKRRAYVVWVEKIRFRTPEA